MKKMMVLSVFILVFGINGLFAGDFVQSLNFALGSAMEDGHVASSGGSSAETDVKSGFSLIYEGHGLMTNNVDFGFGIEIMTPRELDLSGTDANFTFLPAYASFVMHPYRYTDFLPYFSLQLGYNLVYDGNDDYKGSGDTAGGLYSGVAVGMLFSQSTKVELRYARYEGSYESGLFDLDIAYDEFSLVVGYSF